MDLNSGVLVAMAGAGKSPNEIWTVIFAGTIKTVDSRENQATFDRGGKNTVC